MKYFSKIVKFNARMPILFAISLIFPLKKLYFILLTILLNLSQSSNHLDCLYIEVLTAIIIPPSFGVLYNIDSLRVFILYTVNIISERVDYFFKYSTVMDGIHFKILDKVC